MSTNGNSHLRSEKTAFSQHPDSSPSSKKSDSDDQDLLNKLKESQQQLAEATVQKELSLAREIIGTLSTIPHRVAPAAGERTAAEWLRNRFQGLGLYSSMEPFLFNSRAYDLFLLHVLCALMAFVLILDSDAVL